MYLEKIFEKSVDLITPVLSSSSLHTKKNGKKNLYSAFDPLKCPPILHSLHQINLTIVFIFHFLSLDSIDYIMIILELISPQTAHYWAKILAYYTKKITIIKKKRRPNIVTALLPARDQLQKQQKKANFWSTDPTKNIKRIQKFDPPHLYWLVKESSVSMGFNLCNTTSLGSVYLEGDWWCADLYFLK